MGGGMSIEMWLAEDDESVKEHELQQRVFDELAAEPGLDMTGIRVGVHGCAVTLSGGVQRYGDKIAAGRVAWAVPGVQALRNGLAVLRRAEEGPMKRWPSILAGLCGFDAGARDPRLDRATAGVVVVAGRAKGEAR